ncbi:MAG: SCO7613 C-terminal domain-containing membrane protein [Micromonosporaceae bacterium]
MAEATTPTYPCPVCGAGANLTTGCPGCGRGPDPDAAEVIALDQEIARLNVRLAEARNAYTALDAQAQTLRLRREQVVGRVRFAVSSAAATAARPPSAPAETARDPQAGGREASTRTVQNVLFILGGLLLGTAAIVFTAIAWATFGVTGRAGILAAVTALALGVPLLALWRGLRATAETFAGLGLLLVALDGYAAWGVDLFGVQSLPATRYAGLVGLATAIVAVAYRAGTRLVGPAFAALAVTQPILPLLAAETNPSLPATALVYAGVAVIDLGVLVWWRPKHRTAVTTAVRGCTWLLYAGALAVAGLLALIAEAIADTPGQAAPAGAAVVVVALLLVGGAALIHWRPLHHGAGAALVLAVALGAGRLTALSWPGQALVASAAVVGALAVAVTAAVRWLPRSVRGGPIGGAVAAAGLVAAVVTGESVRVALRMIVASFPVWHADLADTATADDWRLLAALGLVAASLVVLLPRATGTVVAAGATMLALALPGATALPWWAPSTIDMVVCAALALGAMLAGSARDAAVRAVLGLGIAGHGLLAGAARAQSTSAVLATLTAIGVAVAILAGPPVPAASLPRRIIGGLGLCGAYLAAPWALATGLAAAGVPPWWLARVCVAGTVLLLLSLVAVRRWRGHLLWYAYPGALGAALLGPAWPGVVRSAEPVAVYAAVALLMLAAALLLTPRRHPAAAALTGAAAFAPAVVLGLDALPSVAAVLLAPYAWLGAVWSGTPVGVGLAPHNPGDPALGDATALAILAVAAAVAAYAWSRTPRASISAAALVGPVALVVGVAALSAPWPIVAALSLGAGLALCLAAAIRLTDRTLAGALTAPAFALAGAGLAGMLPTRPATLTALAVTLAASAAVGAAGRTPAVRTLGWLASVATGLTTAAAASLAAEMSLRMTAFAVLGAAALALAGSIGLTSTRPGEARALAGGAHAGAVVALLFTFGSVRHVAAVCTLWGLAVGMRALWPTTSTLARGVYATAAAACELVAWWLLLADRQVALVEAYSLPLAAVALLGGFVARRARTGLRSWVAYGPALFAAFLPSLASILATEGDPLRRLLLGVSALAIVLGGAVRRLQAPVVVGAAVLVLVAGHELVLFWDYVPRWIPLALGGLVLVGVAMTYERRRRDMVRLRGAVSRMS